MRWPSWKDFKSSAGWEQEYFLFCSVSEWAGVLLIRCVFTDHGPPTDLAFEQLSGHDPVSEGEEITRERLHKVQQSPGQCRIQELTGSFNSKWAQSVHVIPNGVEKD